MCFGCFFTLFTVNGNSPHSSESNFPARQCITRVEIRSLQPDELHRFVDTLWFPLGREMAALDDFNTLGENVREDAIAYHRRAVTDDERTVLVAVEEDKFVGFINAKREEPMSFFDRQSTIHIIEVYVREQSRQRGVASALLQEIEGWEKAEDCEYASLVVHVDTHAAQSLYEDTGFEAKRNLFAKPLR